MSSRRQRSIPLGSSYRQVSLCFESELYIDGLVQERRNSIANALQLRLFCTTPSIWYMPYISPTDIWRDRSLAAVTCTVSWIRSPDKGQLLHPKDNSTTGPMPLSLTPMECELEPALCAGLKLLVVKHRKLQQLTWKIDCVLLKPMSHWVQRLNAVY